MNNKNLWWVLLVIVLISAGAIYYNNIKVNDTAAESARQQALSQEESRPDITINVKYQFKNGVHYFLGDLELPNACYAHNAEVKKHENDIEIALTTTAPTDPNLICAEVITAKPFKVQFEAPQDTIIYATLNGETVNLNIFEVGPDEDLEKVELFFKG